MKTLYLSSLLATLACINAGFAMEQEPQVQAEEALFSKFQVVLPLRPEANASTLNKDVYVQIPNNLVRASQDAYKQKLIQASVASSVANTLIAVYEQEAEKEIQEVLKVFVSLMFNNASGSVIPMLGTMAHVDPELFALVQVPETYFMYSREEKQLLLRWDLGAHSNGWAFDKVLAVLYKPEHPRRGTRSLLTVQYHNKSRNIHDKVSLEELRDLYAKAGKQTSITADTIATLRATKKPEEINKLQAADVVAMAQHYVANFKEEK